MDAVEITKARKIPVKDKEKIINRIVQLADEAQTDTMTCTEAFVKAELTFGPGWPRMVAARTPALRAISQVIYEQIHQ